MTPEHPFRVVDGGWVAAGDLTTSDQLDGVEGALRVASIRRFAEDATVFNLEVRDAHTYFVGELGAWVHNTCLPTGPQRIANSNMDHAATRAVERAGFPTKKAAREALQDFGANIEKNGLPSGAIRDTAHADRVIVPGFGNGGAVVYQEGKSSMKLKTVMIWIPPE